MEATAYRGPQVCKLAGITYRQLDYWARTHLVLPSVMDANGSGTQRLYSPRDVVELKVVKQLLDAGISLQTARKAIAALHGRDLASAYVVILGESVLLAESDAEVMDLLRRGESAIVVILDLGATSRPRSPPNAPAIPAGSRS